MVRPTPRSRRVSADLIKVNARGIISGMSLSTIVPCGVMPTEGRRCAWRTFHINISQLTATLGLTIQTG